MLKSDFSSGNEKSKNAKQIWKKGKITEFPSLNSEECGLFRFPVETKGWGRTTEKEGEERRKWKKER